MVEQRELPPRRSLPLVLEARTLGSRIHMEYDSGLEGFGPGPVEDDFSSPMVAAWDARDASRLALCGLGRLALQLRARREPLFESRIPRLRGLGAEFPGGATRSLAPAAVPGLYHLPSEPRPFGLEIDAAATVRIAWLDRCDARDDQPLSGFVARLATRTGEVLQEPVRVAVPGPTRIQVAPVRAKRFTLVLHREESRPWEGPLVSVDLAWRWGRPEESWMDQGRPGMPPARLRDEGPARIRAQLEALQFAWNPDDEVFVDPEGGQGLGSRARIMDVLWGAVQILGGGVPDRPVGAPEGSQTALALALAEAQVAATIQDPPQVVDPFRSREMVPSWVPWNALTAALEEAGRVLREVHGGRSWTTPIARTLALALHRYLARPEPGQREPLLALVRDFEAARTAGPDPVVERWIGKGTSSFVPAPEDPMGPLWATMVQVAADGLDPGMAGRSPREDPRVEGLADHPRVRGLHALRLRRPRPDDHPPADHRQTAPEPSTAELGDAARIASWLASRHPGPGIVRLAERLVEACWRRYVQDAVTLGFEARLDLLQAFVPLR